MLRTRLNRITAGLLILSLLTAITPAHAAVERHDPFLRCLILISAAGDLPGATVELKSLAETMRTEAGRIRTGEPDGGELLDRYVVVLRKLQDDGFFSSATVRDEATGCAADRRVLLDPALLVP